MPVRKRISPRRKSTLPVRGRADSIGVAIVISTFGNEDAAVAAAYPLVSRGLCACVSLLSVRSIYVWKGQSCDEREVAALFKTSSDKVERLKKALLEVHPYEVPEIIEVKTDSSSSAYLEWVIKSSKGVAQQSDDASQGRHAQPDIR